MKRLYKNKIYPQLSWIIPKRQGVPVLKQNCEGDRGSQHQWAACPQASHSTPQDPWGRQALTPLMSEITYFSQERTG